MTRRLTALTSGSLCAVVLAGLPGPAGIGPVVGQPETDGVARLEFDLPSEAKVVVNGRPLDSWKEGIQRKLPPGSMVSLPVRVQLGGSRLFDGPVYLEGGRVTRLALAAPDISRGGMVLQAGHKAAVTAVAVSPDGRRVVTASLDRTAILWDVATGRQLVTFRGHKFHVWSVAFSPNGDQIATGSGDGSVIVWDARTGEPIAAPIRVDNTVFSVAFGADGKTLLTACGNVAQHQFSGPAEAALWDLANPAAPGRRFVNDMPFPVWSAALSPDGGRVLTASSHLGAVLWDVTTGKRIDLAAKVPMGAPFAPDEEVPSVAFSPDGRWFLIGATLWDAKTDQPVARFAEAGEYRRAVFAPNGSLVAVARTGGVDLYDTGTRRQVNVVPHDPRATAVALGRGPDDRRVLAVAGGGNELRAGPVGVWDVHEPGRSRPLARLIGTADIPWAVAPLANGYRVVTGRDGGLDVQDFEVRQARRPLRWPERVNSVGPGGDLAGRSTPASGHGLTITSVAFSSDGSAMLAGVAEPDPLGEVIFWAGPGLTRERSFRAHVGVFKFAAVRPGGTEVLAASTGAAVRWDAATSKEIGRFDAGGRAVLGVAYRQDVPVVLVVSEREGGVDLWDAATGRIMWAVPGRNVKVETAAVAPDGGRVVTGSTDGVVCVWAVGRGDVVATFRGPQSPVRTIDLDGDRVAVGYANGRVLIWAVGADRPQREWEVPPPADLQVQEFRGGVGGPLDDDAVPQRVTLASFSPDGKRLLVARQDGTVAVRDLGTGVTREHKPAQRVAAAALGPDGNTAFVAHQSTMDAAIAGQPAVPEIVNADTWRRVRLLTAAKDDPLDWGEAAFAPDGSRVIAAGNGRVTIWDLKAGTRVNCRDVELGLGQGIQCVAISPKGDLALGGGPAKTTVLWNTRTGRVVAVLPKQDPGEPLAGEAVTSAAFSDDGLRVVTGSLREACTWDTKTRTSLTRFRPRIGAVRAVGFVGGKAVALTEEQSEHHISLWDIGSGKRVADFGDHRGSVSTAAFAPDGKTVLLGFGDGAAYLWETGAGRKATALQQAAPRKAPAPANPGAANAVRFVRFRPDGKRLAAVSEQGTVVVWDAESGRKVRSLYPEEQLTATVSWSADGRVLYTGGRRTTGDDLLGWDAETLAVEGGAKLDTQNLRITLLVPGNAPGVVASAGGGVSSAGASLLWTIGSDRPPTRLEFPAEVTAVGFSPDDRSYACGTSDGKVRMARRDGQGKPVEIDPFNGQDGRLPVFGVALSSSGRRAVIRLNHSTLLWDIEARRSVEGAEINVEGQYAETRSSAFSPVGKWLAVGGGGQAKGVIHAQLYLCDAATGRRVRALQAIPANPAAGWANGHRWYVDKVAFSPDGRFLLSGSMDGTVILWDVESGRKLRTLAGHDGAVTGLGFTPDGRQMLTTASDFTTRVWDFATGAELARLISFDGGAHWAAVSPDGLFDGDLAGRQKVFFQTGVPGGAGPAPDRLVPVDNFFLALYRCGLTQELRSGHRPLPEVQLGEKQPPVLRLMAPRPLAGGRLLVPVEVEDVGGGSVPPWAIIGGTKVNPKPGPIVRLGRVSRWEFDVPLTGGGEAIEIYSSREDRLRDSDPARIPVPGKEPTAQPRLFVIAVGVGAKADPFPELQTPAGNAKAVAELLAKRARGLYAGEPVVQVLGDARASKDGIRKAIEKVAAQAAPTDVVVFFFSGHGVIWDLEGGRGAPLAGRRFYLIPHGYKSTGGAITLEDLHAQALSADELADSLSGVPALNRMLILDTCHSAGVVFGANQARDPFAFRGSVEGVVRSGGAYTLVAASPDKETFERSDGAHSIFSYLLLGGLGADVGRLETDARGDQRGIRVDSIREWLVGVTKGWREKHPVTGPQELSEFVANHFERFVYKSIGVKGSQVHYGGRGINFRLARTTDR